MVCLSGGGFIYFLRKRERESLVFQPVHAHSGPWKETKGSQGQARLENEGRVIDQTLPGCSCGGEGKRGLVVVGAWGVEGAEIELQHRRAHAVGRRAVCTQERIVRPAHNTARIIMAPGGWHGGGVGGVDGGMGGWGWFGGGKYLPPGIITGPLLAAARPLGEPD